MKHFVAIVFSLLTGYSIQAQSTSIPSAENQIKTAVMAAPAEMREGATVLGYNQKGEVVTLRKGTNELICLADDPNQAGFSVSCYHRDLEPFMSRGRELRRQGMSANDIFETREKEAKSGKLTLPKQATSLFVYSAPEEQVNMRTGEVADGYLRYVVYIPWATAESTGLPLKPDQGSVAMPWIMHPGTHGAHIMINPPRSKAGQ
ncbi:hypothetical protein K3G39_19450 [Pontibacter sp. HSC-14F20]|uniref:hypothetical protein n=1 Tax=Pontibacter sp. HSC-14F20 TaxID=2864136 RepID=UPI001C736799|nr:hypothetical protein [Pontibacter sp. HSC-14F20]MBX0335416.1 hypothetical protein [Pontibacter sp. HSC-14F20]